MTTEQNKVSAKVMPVIIKEIGKLQVTANQ